jgi:subtilisin-like proprotein convertase family protein
MFDLRGAPRRATAVLTAAAALVALAVGGTATPAGAAVTGTYSNGGTISVPDSGTATPYPSTVTVAGAGAEITKVTVRLNAVSHSCVKDLDVLLVGPDGTQTVLMSDNGEVAINFDDCNDIGTSVVVDDAGSSWGTSVPGGNPVTFRPSDNDALGHQGDTWSGVAGSDSASAQNLSVFNGKNPNGAWKLHVVDDAGSDSGSIGGWSLDVTTANGPPTATNQAIDAHKGEAVAVTLGGTDPDGDSLTCQPTLGATAKGTVSGSGCAVTYTAGTRTEGSDSFAFRLRDTANTQSGVGTVSVSIINRPPTGTDQAVAVPAGSTVAVALGGVDPDPGESLALTCGPELGETVSAKGSVSGSGCNVTYRAKPGSSGTDEFDFTVADGFGGLASGTVTVEIGPATLPGCTPSDTKVARYVCRVYLDMLGRPAEPSGKAYWIQRIGTGEPRYAILNAFSRTNEHRARLVKVAYRTFLGREADTAAVTYWKGRLATTSLDVLRAALLGSPEMLNRAGGIDGWAPALYQLVLRRPATPQEAATAKAQATTGGKTRQQVAAALLATPEADTVTTQAIYEQYLRRTPPGSEVSFWVGRLQAGTFETTMVVQIVASAEYYDKA